MKNFNQIFILILLSSPFLNAEEDSFNKQHKINKSYIKARTYHEINQGNSNATHIKIKNKKELNEKIQSGELHKTYKKKGDKHIVIEIKNVHLSKKELKELDGVIGSTIDSKGKVNQIISMDGVKLDTDELITIGVETSSSEVDSITSVTTITNSQIGGN